MKRFNPERIRRYRLFYKASKYTWSGPPLRQVLKLLCPHQQLGITAEDCYYLTSEDLAPWHPNIVVMLCFFDMIAPKIESFLLSLDQNSPNIVFANKGSTIKKSEGSDLVGVAFLNNIGFYSKIDHVFTDQTVISNKPSLQD